jgi:uncharacterized protein (UPF0305 family)
MVIMSELNPNIFEEIADITERSELARALAYELAKYTIYDIMKIRAFQDREINLLPSPYREKARPYFIEWHLGRHTKVMAMLSNGGFQNIKGPIQNLSLFREFCDTESKSFKVIYDENDDDSIYGPFHSLYYLQLSCFYMFALEEPGHPIGTPFPGGFTVKKCSDGYLCPIREKEKDIEYSICNFCPAKQDESNK